MSKQISLLKPITIWFQVKRNKQSFHHISQWWRIGLHGCGNKAYCKKHNITWIKKYGIAVNTKNLIGWKIPTAYTFKELFDKALT